MLSTPECESCKCKYTQMDSRTMNISPFTNDPFVLIAKAFHNLFPDRQYTAEISPDPMDAYGVTIFSNDGQPPHIQIVSSINLNQAMEVFAHELAHVAVGISHQHDDEWEAAFNQINTEYNRIGEDLFGN